MNEIAIVEGEPTWIAVISKVEKGWLAVKLIDVTPHVQRHKRFYHLGWDGERFAKGGELKSLETHHPDIAAALAAKMTLLQGRLELKRWEPGCPASWLPVA